MGDAERLVRRLPALPAGVGEPAHDAGPILTRLGHAEGHLWLLSIWALVADALLTAVGLRLGMTEVNPVVAETAASLGPLLGVVILKSVSLGVGVACARSLPLRQRPLVPLALGSVWTLAAVVNLLGLALLLT